MTDDNDNLMDHRFPAGEFDDRPEVRTIEPGSECILVSREAALAQLKWSAEDIMSGSQHQITTLHYTLGPDHGYFIDIVLPVAHELAGERSIVIVDPTRETPIPDDCFPLLVLSGGQMSKAWMKAFMRLEVSDALAKVLSDRQRYVLVYLTLLERIPEPIQPHLRLLLDRNFSLGGDSFEREGTTSILMQIDWHRRKDPGISNVLDPGNCSRLGKMGVDLEWC